MPAQADSPCITPALGKSPHLRLGTTPVNESAPAFSEAGAPSVTVRLPAALGRLARDRAAIKVHLPTAELDAITVSAVLGALASSYPGVHHAVLDERGTVRPHVNVFVGDENIRFGKGLDTPVPIGSEVWILPAVSGG